jgi:hypothetical protein
MRDPADVAAALAGAVRMALRAPLASAVEGAGKRYGIVTPGQNGCSKPVPAASARPLAEVERKIVDLAALRPRPSIRCRVRRLPADVGR